MNAEHRGNPAGNRPGRRAVLATGLAAASAGLAGCGPDGGAYRASDALVRTAAQVAPGAAAGSSAVDVVRDFGARGDGRSDDSDAFAAAYAHAAARVSGGVGRTVVDVPAGTYLVTRPDAMLAGTDAGRPANGLRFRGAGKRMSQLVFAPGRADGAYLCRNEDQWANVSFERLGFRSAVPGASFFYSYSTGQAQDYRFSECEWLGEWTYGLALDGTDCNSEMRWQACRVGGAYRKAFLYAGLSDRSDDPAAQDQFLNYWFTDMKVEYDWGNFLEFPYGGSITCRGGSYIVTGSRPSKDPEYGSESTFFRFPRRDHHGSVQRFHAEDIRFEVRRPDVVVIDCHWGGGTVHFNDCDDGALSFKPFAAGTAAHRYAVGARGPLVRYDSCQLGGVHRYSVAGEVPERPVARYDMCLLTDHKPESFLQVDGAPPASVAVFGGCLGTD